MKKIVQVVIFIENVVSISASISSPNNSCTPRSLGALEGILAVISESFINPIRTGGGCFPPG